MQPRLAAASQCFVVSAMRILFLDLDGVICCNMHGELERDKLFQVVKICNATNAKVVLSTDWRRRPELRRRAEQTLSGLGVECVGATPEYAMYSRVRPKEIVAWMNDCKEPIDGWVAIDDRDLVLEEGAIVRGKNVFSKHFVLTEFHSGLTTALADVAIARLLAESSSPAAPAPRPGLHAPPAPAPAPASRPHAAPSAPAPSSRQPLHAPRPDDALPNVRNLRELLDEAELLHLEPLLPHVTLLSMHETLSAPHGGGRVALLAHLRGLGIHKIGERQGLANAFSKAQRQGRISSPPEREAPTPLNPNQEGAHSPAISCGTTPPDAPRRAADGAHPPTRTAERDQRAFAPSALGALHLHDARATDVRATDASEGHLRGFAYAPSVAPTRTPSEGSVAAANLVAPPPLLTPKEERSVPISAPGSKLRVANALMSLQPNASRGAIVTHPHPGRGGDMYNAFVGQCVQSLRHAGISTLRFNFSAPDGSGEEMDDLLAANIDELSAALHVFSNAAPDAAIVLIGYSWGAVVALAAARKAASQPDRGCVAAVALFAPPIDMIPPSLHPGRGDFARWPILLAAGDADEYCSAAKLRALAGDSPATLVLMADVDHFLHGGHAEQAAAHAVEWLGRLELQ